MERNCKCLANKSGNVREFCQISTYDMLNIHVYRFSFVENSLAMFQLRYEEQMYGSFSQTQGFLIHYPPNKFSNSKNVHPQKMEIEDVRQLKYYYSLLSAKAHNDS